MPAYIYKARDKQGELVTGTLEAEDQGSVVFDLEHLGYSVVEVSTEGGLDVSLDKFFARLKPLDKREVIIFTRQLATLLRTGTALVPTLVTVCDQTVDKRFRAILEDVKQAVQGGSSLSKALSKHPEAFSELFVSMVEVGETGGILDKSLDRLAVLGTQEMEMSSRIKSALVYPIVLVGVAFLIVNFLVIGVLPKFVAVFRASGASLPLPTQFVLGMSWLLRNFWWLIALIIVGTVAAFRNHIKKSEDAQLRFHSMLLKVPVFGPLYSKVQISRFSRILSALLASGIPLLQALVVVEKTITNVVIRKAIQTIRFALAQGQSLVKPFQASGIFSPMVVQMIATGEKTGKLDQMLAEVASFYDPEIEYTVKNLTALLEPFMLLAMGAMVGFIALSVLLPIFNLIKVFRA